MTPKFTKMDRYSIAVLDHNPELLQLNLSV